ncbi:P-loop containing nucleoside triphosphate hydrolase protein [Xylariaceae sp. FL0662B]|nr:P-loop containing nucleoside triphosphate hydrolase protein [Xylariaceae sp. FL0662B]
MDEDTMGWSEEEIRYIRALLSWDPSERSDSHEKPIRREDPPAAGQFMFLVLGDKGCGKTSMVERFCQGTFRGDDEPPDPKYEKGCRHRIKIEDEVYILNALELDSSAHASAAQQLEDAIQITEAAVLVYSVASRASFGALQGLHDRVCATVSGAAVRGYSLLLVGTHADCADTQREVSWSEGYGLAHSFRLRCAFLETSAKTGHNVHRLFPLLAKEVLELRWVTQQRREEAERLAAAADAGNSAEKRMAKWKTWTRSWAQLKSTGRKASATV